MVFFLCESLHIVKNNYVRLNSGKFTALNWVSWSVPWSCCNQNLRSLHLSSLGQCIQLLSCKTGRRIRYNTCRGKKGEWIYDDFTAFIFNKCYSLETDIISQWLINYDNRSWLCIKDIHVSSVYDDSYLSCEAWLKQADEIARVLGSGKHFSVILT